MKVPRRSLWLAAAVLLMAARPAVAVDVTLGCPADAAAGSTVTTSLRLVNDSCLSGYNVRVIASIAGNADQSLGGVGIAGPVVVDPLIFVPAGTSTPVFPFCTSSVVDVNIPTPPAIPASLAGTVATLVVISEWDGLAATAKDVTEVTQCLVNVTPAL